MILKKNTGTEHKNLRFLIINPFGIGDVLFTTPLIKALKQYYPASFIGYWSNFRVKPILKSNHQVNRVFSGTRGDFKKICQESFFKGLWQAHKLFWDIRKERFDICLDFSLDHRYSLFTKLIGIKKRIGFNYKGRGRFLTHRLDLDGYGDKHMVEYYLELLSFLGIPASSKNLYLGVSSTGESKARNILSAYGIEENDLVI